MAFLLWAVVVALAVASPPPPPPLGRFLPDVAIPFYRSGGREAGIELHASAAGRHFRVLAGA
jgi:hypothetical protein